eukprot:994214-Rhodomonas_salina.1
MLPEYEGTGPLPWEGGGGGGYSVNDVVTVVGITVVRPPDAALDMLLRHALVLARAMLLRRRWRCPVLT